MQKTGAHSFVLDNSLTSLREYMEVLLYPFYSLFADPICSWDLFIEK